MRIKDIGIVVTGKTPSTNNLANYSTNDCMFVTPDDILDDTYIVRKTKRYISRTGLQSILSNSIKGTSIAVTCIGEVGRCAILHDSCATNQQINSITDIDTKIVEPVALYYWFKCCGKQLINYASQTVMPIVSKSTFENIQIELPDIEHQKALVNMLSHVDDLIENNTNLSNKLSDIISLIYAYWFVQFDFPDENSRPYKSSGGKMVYNEQLKQEIPEGWEVVDLSDIFSMKQPEQLNKATMSNNPGEHRVYGSNGVIGSYNKYNYADSAIAVSCRGNCGNVYRTMPQSWITGNAMVVTPLSRTSIMHNAYIMLLLRSLNLKSATTGSIQGQITRTNLSRIKTIIPDRNIINSFNNVADTIYDLQIILEDESTKLASLRDWLLPMLMNGQVRINASKEQNNEN